MKDEELHEAYLAMVELNQRQDEVIAKLVKQLDELNKLCDVMKWF